MVCKPRARCSREPGTNHADWKCLGLNKTSEVVAAEAAAEAATGQRGTMELQQQCQQCVLTEATNQWYCAPVLQTDKLISWTLHTCMCRMTRTPVLTHQYQWWWCVVVESSTHLQVTWWGSFSCCPVHRHHCFGSTVFCNNQSDEFTTTHCFDWFKEFCYIKKHTDSVDMQQSLY